jgi:hypothetical protein
VSKFLLALSLFTTAGLIATEANAACFAGGNLRISQGSYAVRCNISQSGTALTGNCTSGKSSGGSQNGGDIVGGSFLKNGQFKMVVLWDGGSRGIYTAFVDSDGSVTDGTTRDAANLGSFAKWTTSRRFACT